MGKPTERDYKVAVRMIHSSSLDYKTALICLQIMKAYVGDRKIPLGEINQFRLIQIHNENHHRYGS